MIRAAAVWLGLACAAAADPAALLRIEITGSDAAPAAIEAGPADILSVEDAPGHGGRSGLKVRLDARFDAPFARMTRGRDGDVVIVMVCGQELLRATLRGDIPSALFTLSFQDPAVRSRVKAALAGGDCVPAASS